MSKKYNVFDLCYILGWIFIFAFVITFITLLCNLKFTEFNIVIIVFVCLFFLIIISVMFLFSKVGDKIQKLEEEKASFEQVKQILEIKEETKNKENL